MHWCILMRFSYILQPYTCVFTLWKSQYLLHRLEKIVITEAFHNFGLHSHQHIMKDCWCLQIL